MFTLYLERGYEGVSGVMFYLLVCVLIIHRCVHLQKILQVVHLLFVCFSVLYFSKSLLKILDA